MLPGIALCAALMGCAFAVRALPGLSSFSPLILAIALGIVVRNTVGRPEAARSGIRFSMRTLLRVAIVALGAQISLGRMASIGLTGVAIALGCLVATFVLTERLAPLFGVERGLARLIAAGTSVCGAAAVVAANDVVRSSDEDVAYAVATVTVFGSLAVFAYPLLPFSLVFAPHAYGVWAGASIHEIAQVVAAGFARGAVAGEAGIVTKLVRVMMLAPLLLVLSAGNRNAGARPPIPWFAFGFIGMVIATSVVPLPRPLLAAVNVVDQALFAMALGAMGLETSIVALRRKGFRPLALAAVASLFIATVAYSLVRIAG